MVEPHGPAWLTAEAIETTRAVCPACFAEGRRSSSDPRTFIAAELVAADGAVWLRRHCPRHGITASLYEEDAALWQARRGWEVEARGTAADRPGGCGCGPGQSCEPTAYRDGLPDGHGQHTCILVLNLTDRCDLACTTCYAAARGPGSKAPQDWPTLDEVEHTVRTMIAREGGKLDVLMLSGGEPTLRDDLAELFARLSPLAITRIMLNTNGVRLAHDDRLLALLAEHRRRAEVYLQFDGLSAATSLALRDEDLVATKLAALQRLDQAGVATSLVMTLQRGVNEHEIGDVLRLGLATPHCSGMAIQPVFGSGRGRPIDPLDRVTPTGAIRRLAEQSRGLLQPDDVIPLPCGHPDCCDLAYLVRDANEQWRSLISLIGRDQLPRWLPLISNTITFDTLQDPVQAALQHGGGQLAAACNCLPGLDTLVTGLRRLFGRRPKLAGRLPERAFRITLKQFMDVHTFVESRLQQCCVHTGTFEEDPRRYSFCWRWLFADASDRPQPEVIPLASLLGS